MIIVINVLLYFKCIHHVLESSKPQIEQVEMEAQWIKYFTPSPQIRK